MAHEEGNLNDIRAILGNDVAINAYREGKLPFPDDTIIARLAVQFMVKDSRKYASTGGWGSLNLTTANLPMKQCTKPASPATRPSKLAILSSTVTHLERSLNGFTVPRDRHETLGT